MKKINIVTKDPRGMKRLYALGEKRKFDLSLSENPLGCSPKVGRVLADLLNNFSEYPEPNGLTLKRALVKDFGCEPRNIFVANGSESIISSIPRVFAGPGDEVLVAALSFPMFQLCSELAGLSVVLVPMTPLLEIDLEAMLRSITKKTKLIFVCNPNNPTGSVIPKDKLLRFLVKIPPSVLAVVDEAAIGFGGESVIADILKQKLSNVLVLRTFSKAFGLADLRIGFAVGATSLVFKLEEEQPLFPVSGMNEIMAVAALTDPGFLVKTKNFVDSQRMKMKTGLEALGFTVFPSESNNLFVKLPAGISSKEFSSLLERESISLVMGSMFSGFDDSFFRVSIREEELNTRFLAVVSKFINEVQ